MKKKLFILLSTLLCSCTLQINTSQNSSTSSVSSSASTTTTSSTSSSSTSSTSEYSSESSLSEDSSLNFSSSEYSSSDSISTSQSDDVWNQNFLPANEIMNVEEVDQSNYYTDAQGYDAEEQGAETSKTNRLNFFELNDTHGAINTCNDFSGMDKIATMMNENVSQNGDYINLLVGDIFQGSWLSNKTYGEAFIDTLNYLEFSCFVLGNHEFDWGLDKIAKYKDGKSENGELNMPILGANIYYANTDKHPNWIAPYTIVNSNGYRVGIIGAIGEAQYSSISSDKAAPYEFKNTNTLISKYSKVLRTEKNCDVVVLAIHEYDETNNQYYGTLSGDSRLDAIFCAHTHQRIEEYVVRGDNYNVPVIQSNTKNISAGIINMTLDENNNISSCVMKHKYGEDYEQDGMVKSLINNKYRSLINEGEEAIGYTSTSISKSKIGDDTVKYMNKTYNGDYACINTGGVRASIDMGYIKNSKLLEVYPFDNRVLLVKISGYDLNKFINGCQNYLYFENRQLLIESNKEYKLVIIDFVYMRYLSYFKNTKYYFDNTYIRDIYHKAIVEKYN